MQENPKTSKCVGVFGLSLYTEERDLRDVFGRYGPIEEIQVVYDHQTGRSRGFAFIYYRNLIDAEDVSFFQSNYFIASLTFGFPAYMECYES